MNREELTTALLGILIVNENRKKNVEAYQNTTKCTFLNSSSIKTINSDALEI